MLARAVPVAGLCSLHPVAQGTHPLQVALGSNKILYYSYHSVHASRFTHDYVAKAFETRSLLADSPVDGFIFDTKTLCTGRCRVMAHPGGCLSF